ncbi:RagB/SusD family nutrient uptake outer membrane protein [Arachidicoccus sp.]|uniref:RagB/SusD family nutrient uptake outer membrane protein n=1 Tax=Arachidicoccus sp. TaxID=1872624 RepID=UPI003D1B4F10
MIKHIKVIFSLILIITVSTSCNKWLEVKPQDGIIRDNYWKTKEQFGAAVIGCYSSLLDPQLVTDLFAWGELRADMVGTTLKTSTDAINIMEGNILSSNSFTDWSVVYRTINDCNTVLEYGPGVIKNDATLTVKQQNAYLAEAHTIRALMYFYLLRTFGEVPLQLSATSTDNEVTQLVKSSQLDVYNQIITDLKFAQQNAVETYGNINTDKGRITKNTVFSIEADAYLWEDKYDSCIAACDSVINSQKYGLVSGTDQSQWFNTLYFNGNSSEGIFEFQFDQQALNPFYNQFISSSKLYVAAPNVSSDIFGLDHSGLQKDIRGDGGSMNAIDGTILKYAAATGGESITLRTADQSFAHWFVYRYADILMMKAEALTWVNRGGEALTLVQTIRDRAHAIDETVETPDSTSADDIAQYILDERAREFAFEGKRWFDVLRFAKRNNYKQLGVLLDVVKKNAPTYLQQTIVNKYKDVRSHYLPINQDELQADKKLIQNPFYQ